ncbi:MAG TPA: helix-turn-helix domain-containing protein [Candidatus Paceibacterota bacterium]|nr:helix-turn-helix domain-containing protein [Verrucomicrobiota bacterium]HSA12551.1 helix-turn-helix domain-containing protein [Candidatus Paceibacterota bacterium]
MSVKKKTRQSQQSGDDEMMSRQELADWLKVCVGAIDRYCRKEKLPFIKVGRRVLFRRRDVERWLEKRLKNGEGGGEK